MLPGLDVSNKSIKYYASSVGHYSVYMLKQQNEWVGYVYLLCFIHYRFQRMHDNLEEAKLAAREKVYECYTEGNLICKKGKLLSYS